MSVQASAWVWEHSRAEGGAFVVLLSLADHAGADGGDAWPSVERLAKRCRLSVRAVQYALKELVRLEEVEVSYRSGPHGTNRYRVLLGGADSAGGVQRVQGASGSTRGAKRRGQVVQLRAPKPTTEPSIEPRRELTDEELRYHTDPNSLTPAQLQRQIELSEELEPMRTFR